jgi:hypothetical protein
VYTGVALDELIAAAGIAPAEGRAEAAAAEHASYSAS